MKEAKKRGIAEYTLGSPGQGYCEDWILKKHPEMEGCMLERIVIRIRKGK